MESPRGAVAVTVLAAMGLVVAWSSGFVGAELGTRAAAADTLLFWRYLTAALLLAAWFVSRQRRVCWPNLSRHIGIGVLCQGIYVGGIVTGIGLGVPAGTAALIAALQPLLVTLLVGAMWGSKVSWREAAGLLLGPLGVAVVVLGDVGSGDARWWAYLLPIVGMAGLSLGTVLERTWDLPEPLGEALTIQVVTVAVLIGVEATVAGRLSPPATWDFWFAVVWVVALSTFGGYGFYFFVLRRTGPAHVSALLNLSPPCTLVWAALMLGQAPGWAAYGGFLICGVGIGLVLRGETRSHCG